MHIRGQSRHQGMLFPERLDDLIGTENPVRVIDAFVDRLDLRALGFAKAQSAGTGRPPYDPADLLKLYLYGYLHRIRSSRPLERECHKNIEVLWLLNRLAPDHKTICNFRGDNAKALVRVCREFVLFCRSQALFGGELVAIDGSKFKADNHPAKLSRRKELKRQVARIDREIEAWLEGMAEADAADAAEAAPEPMDPERTRRALEALQAERESLTEHMAGMAERGREAEPHTDREAGSMKGGVGYNVQTAVDDKHALIVDYDVVADGNDLKQLYRMARRSRTVLRAGILKALADGGYSNGHLLARTTTKGGDPDVTGTHRNNNKGGHTMFKLYQKFLLRKHERALLFRDGDFVAISRGEGSAGLPVQGGAVRSTAPSVPARWTQQPPNQRDPLSAQHGQGHGEQRGGAASQGAGDPGEDHGKDRQHLRLRWSRLRAGQPGSYEQVSLASREGACALSPF